MKNSVNFNPNEVDSESQKKKILDYLKEGETITSLEALDLFHCFRLASRMTDLKNMGVSFDSTFVTTPSAKRVKAYFIPELFAEKHHLEIDDDFETSVKIYAEAKIANN